MASAIDVSNSLKDLASKAQSTQTEASAISLVNIGLAVTGQGPIPTVATRLQDEATACSNVMQKLTDTKPFTAKADQEAISGSFKDFVQVHQALLNTLIGKAQSSGEMLSIVGSQIAQPLRQLEVGIDSVLFQIRDLYKGDQKDLEKQHQALEDSLSQAIDKWSGN